MYILGDDASSLGSWIKKEVNFPGNTARGKRGMVAKRIQEWLCLHHLQVVVDGDFGGVTEDALMNFQTDIGLPATGLVDKITHDALVAPMTSALRNQIDVSMPFGEAVMAFANIHLAQHPREVGGDNQGPWIRAYMKGNDGPAWLWCAGFVTFCMQQAAEALDMPMPIKGSFSCDTLAAQAKNAGIFLTERATAPDQIPMGAIFLVRRTSTDWTHTGLISQAEATVFQTIEGNTNDDGSSNGYEVCSRRRGYSKKDFILL